MHCFLVFGYPGGTLALVVHIILYYIVSIVRKACILIPPIFELDESNLFPLCKSTKIRLEIKYSYNSHCRALTLYN